MKAEHDSSDQEEHERPHRNHPKHEPKQAHHARRLEYSPDAPNPQKDGQPLKAQTTEVKVKEPKSEKAVKAMLEYYGQAERKKEVDRLAYPPPEKEIPLKASRLPEKTNAAKIQEESAAEAKLMIHKMKVVLRKDLERLEKGEMAYLKVKYLTALSEKLSNVYVKRQFVELKGLKQMERWLDKVVTADKTEMEPSLAVRLGITKILKEMNLTTEQLEGTKHLMAYVQRNRQSQVLELRELSTLLIKQWEYNIMADNQDAKK